MEIKEDDLYGPEIAKLLQEHLDDMAIHSPPESIHALNLEELRQPELTFWTLWNDTELTGCGALKELSEQHGEIKSMRTVKEFLRQGVAAKILQYIITEAISRGYQQLSLETGSMQAFEPARLMYQRFGFEYCSPFADYTADPNSLFMTKTLTS
jgi:putative acetyltransferase